MPVTIRRLLSIFIALCLIFTQTAQAYSLVWLPHTPRSLGSVSVPVARTAPGIAPHTTFEGNAATLAQQPGMEWMGQMLERDDVDWQQALAAHENWDYQSQGLTEAGAIILTIVVTYFTAGAASGVAESAAISAGGGATGAAVGAGLTSLATTAAVSFANNGGDLGQTLEDMGKSENIRGLLTAMVTAGVLSELNTTLGTQDINANSGFTEQLQHNLTNNLASATIDTAINGGDLGENLQGAIQNAFIDTGAAQSADWIGDQNFDDFTHQVAHAIAGCAAGAARAGDCSSGALGAVIGEIAAELYTPDSTAGMTQEQFNAMKTDTINFSRLMAGAAAVITGGDVNVAAAAGGNAAQNNYLSHLEVSELLTKIDECNGDPDCINPLLAAAVALSNSRNPLDLLNPNLARDVAAGNNLLGNVDGNVGAYGFTTSSVAGRLLDINVNQQATANAVPVLQATPDPSQAGVEAILDHHQQWANVGTPALMLVGGPVGLLANASTVAGGSYVAGQGVGAILDGQYGSGAFDLGMGSLAVVGGYWASGMGGAGGVSSGYATTGVNAGVFDIGANITPMTTANAYRTIGANGTFVTPVSSIETITGAISPTTTEITISQAQAATLENALGLVPGSLESSNVLSIVNNVTTRAPRSPLTGNNYFLGGGQGLPSGGAELVIDSIPSAGGQGIRQIIVKVE